ncbi:hypothetical protein GWK16_21800 [Roseomonas sp. JC162]|uniref:Glycosyltransferase RgtA/B/C/D-like domain-containing protein n=1 Tax=Neoroseomonas marina TaxID=1232220 RepID=A0A848EKH6_9PROT|nr:hypothetical protein [Neoroseomonas marina]NMJ43897.1 hypothetical protein [Neoroseomonas marina]
MKLNHHPRPIRRRVIRPELILLSAFHFALLIMIARREISIMSTSNLGLALNSMAINILQGRFDVDPNSILYEGFDRDGRTYAYFGILPALLRLPLLPFIDLSTVQVEGPMRYAAMVIAAIGTLKIVEQLAEMFPESHAHDFLVGILVRAAIFSGPPILLSLRWDIYNEVTLWAWAFASWFVAAAWPLLRAGSNATTGRLIWLVALSGLCLLTRPTTGIGLLLATGLLTIVLMLEPRGGQQAGAFTRFLLAIREVRFLLPAALALLFILAAGGVNYARWDNPFTFADMRAQTEQIRLFPDRLDRLDRYGLFNLDRLWLGLSYYFLPLWAISWNGRLLFQEDASRLVDALELPPSSFFLTDPMTVVLAAIGGVALLRQSLPQVAPGRAIAILAGLTFAPTLMLVAWFMSFRYRVEFMPLFFVLAGLGALRVANWFPSASERRRRVVLATLVFLLVVQIISAHLYAILYGASPYGPSDPYADNGFAAFYAGILGRR